MSGKEHNHSFRSYSIFKTNIGWCGMVNFKKRALRILIGYPKRKQLLKQILDEFGDNAIKAPAAGEIIEKIKRYLSGERVFFNCAIDWSSLSPFQLKVFKVAMKVPYGAVETYGNLAQKVGCPNGSRAVGRALSRNPYPLLIPCHRIVRGDGKLGGFSAGGGVQLKKRLLELEGVDQKYKKEYNRKSKRERKVNP